MFTGIVRTVGNVEQHRTVADGSALTITFDSDGMPTPEVGASVAVDGVCLTVTEAGEGRFTADLSEETLDRTTLANRQTGDSVNLEPSLKAGDELGGHFVFGHVDDVVQITSIDPRDEGMEMVVECPEPYQHLVAEKGSVALDGISLTVNEVRDATFTTRIVPHTLSETTLSERSEGDGLNLEVDMLARYVARVLETGSSEGSALSREDLAEAGFLHGSESSG
jgi:riboflavin synthase